ncbi:MAG: PD40 domain-containing protein [Ignavibacteriae bacterium]|nr:PD40 domain-containing protein [Ignavibacteriota bacterium]MCB0723628.1 PD40 domain-containing protein [Ignavibacteriota bacterium]MCB9244327.1 PD40 domain-containing protein [Ignavibacteriales bacterium]
MKKILCSLLFVLFLASNSFSYNIDKIVYVSTQNPTGLLQVFIMDGDGSNKKQLTNMTTNCLHPELSPDGKKLVFQTDDYRIFYIEDINVPSEPYFVFGGSNPSFTVDGDEIIFNSDHEFISSIYIMAPDAPDADLLAMDGYCNQQELSPDGEKILFSGFLDGTKQIYLADLDDTTDNYLKQISDNEDSNLEPDMTSDGSKFVYAGFDQALRGTIYINKNGVEKELTKGLPSCNQPKFSPDGNTIAFVVIDGTNVNLHVMKDDGSNTTKVPVSLGNIGTFQWIDNENIVYDAGDDDRYSIGIINIYTGESKTLATGGINIHPFILK